MKQRKLRAMTLQGAIEKVQYFYPIFEKSKLL